MNPPDTPPADAPIGRTVTLKWGDLSHMPVLFTNHLLSQAQPQDGMLYLTFGHASPPPFIGTQEEVRAQVEAFDALEITPLARLAVTPEQLRNYIRVLTDNLQRYEEGQALLKSREAEGKADGA